MKKTTILSGQTEVLSSGTLITFDENTTKFIIEMENGFKFKINLTFAEDEGGERRMETSYDKEKLELNMLLHNFNNTFGVGNIKAIPLGKLDNKELFINFRVSSIKETNSKLLNYTFYRNLEEVKEVD